MWLQVDGNTLVIAQMGPNFLLVDEPIHLPPGIASVVMQVDASVRQWNVYLPNGISKDSEWIAISPCANTA
jgi:hypothetical protein